MSLRRTLLLAALLMLVAVVAKFPARVAYAWFAPPGIALQGISGTVWNGAAMAASLNGTQVENLAWDWQAGGLLSAALRYRLEAELAEGFAGGELSLKAGGTAVFRDLSLSMPLAPLAGALQVPGLDGTANARFAELAFNGDAVARAAGTLTIDALRIPLVSPASLGGYAAEFVNVDDDVVAAVEDTDGVIDVAATLTLRADRSWLFSGQVAATATTPAALRNNLAFLGPANERGQHSLRFEGRY